MKVFAYRFIRSTAEALILLPFVMWFAPITSSIFGIDVSQMLLAFTFLPIAIALGIIAALFQNTPLKAALFAVSAVLPFYLASLLNFGELATGFAALLFVAFYLKHIIFPKYDAPGIRLAVFSIAALCFYAADIGVFKNSVYLSIYAGILEICAAATFFVSLIAICSEQILLTGWYAKQRVPINRSVIRRYTIYICFFALLTVGVSLLGEAFAAAFGLYDLFVKLLLSALGFIFSIFTPQGGEKPSVGGPVQSTYEPGGAGAGEIPINQAFAPDQFIMDLIRLVSILAVAAAVIIILRLVYKLAKKILGSVRDALFAKDAAEKITDEEDTLEGDETKSLAADFAKKLWHFLTARELYARLDSNYKRARFIYRRVASRRAAKALQAPGSTPREVCGRLESVYNDNQQIKNLPKVYEKARYGDKEPADEDIKSIEKLI